MTRQEIEEKVYGILVDELEIDPEKVSPQASLKEDMGIDSLDLVDVVVLVDKVFGFKIKAEDMKKIKTLEQFCCYLESNVK